jgi:hypothetical protein
LDERFQNNRPIDEQQETANRGVALALLSTVLILPLAIFLALKPATARAAIAEISRIMHFQGNPLRASAAKLAGNLRGSAMDSAPQREAETLLEQAIRHQEGAIEQLASRRDGWRGKLRLDARMTGLLDAALNSNDLRVRGAGIEMELAAYNLPETPASAETLIRRATNEPAARPWALWMIGAIGGRGVEPERALQTLLRYTHDPDEKTRYWTTTGLSLLGSDAAIEPLLDIFRQDSSLQVRESAARGLAQAGMLTKEQRRKAVPTLLKYTEDPAFDARTRPWVYQALREITGASVANTPDAWREWWSENASR